MTETSSATPISAPQGIHHVRLTVTDIARSKAFYTQLLGAEPAMDQSDKIDDPEAAADPAQLFAGVIYSINGQLFGLRPAGTAGDTFASTRVGLDHVSFALASVQELHDAAARLDAAGIEHGEVTDLGAMGSAILSVQDPDGINLEFISSTS